MHFLSVEQDYGDFVHAVFLEPEPLNGQYIQGISVPATLDMAAEAFQKGKSLPVDNICLDLIPNQLHTFALASNKKARYDPIPIKNFEDYGVRGLLGLKKEMLYCQYSGGQFFGEPLDTAMAAKLKATAARARGESSSEGKLTTIDDFMEKHFDEARV